MAITASTLWYKPAITVWPMRAGKTVVWSLHKHLRICCLCMLPYPHQEIHRRYMDPECVQTLIILLKHLRLQILQIERLIINSHYTV